MITKQQNTREKYRGERSGELALACDVSRGLISAVFYDTALHRRYARAAVCGEITALSAGETLVKLVSASMREFKIPASAIKSVGIAAPMHVESCLEHALSPSDLFLPPDSEIFYVPYISAAVGGRFTASLLTLPDEDCVFADFAGDLCTAHRRDGKYACAAFPLRGAFDGCGLESGMAAEKGAIDAVRRERDGTVVYEVVGDAQSTGISPCAAAMAVEIMLKTGSLDGDGIMTDRDLFYIGEDFFVSQSDVRAIQSDKARCAAALELLPKTEKAFFSGEIFSGSAGLKTLISLGAVPERYSKAAFCRNSAEQGMILCLEDAKMREKAFHIAENAEDITETLFPEFDNNALNRMSFESVSGKI